jgi:multiple sugar transport system substrate-binding protein
LTDAAYRAADVSFFNRIQGARELIEQMRQDNGKDHRGFRLNNYHRVEKILDEQFQAAISGKVPPVAALNNAMDQSKPLLAGAGTTVAPSKAPAKK